MDDMEFDDAFGGLAQAAGAGSPTSRLNYPFLVHSKDLTSSDPLRHFLAVSRLDAAGGPVQRLYLAPEDPAAQNTDPNHQRPQILDFAFPPYAEAVRTGDRARQEALIRTEPWRRYVQDGGVVLAEGVDCSEDDYMARWISPLRSAPDDPHNHVYVGFTTVRPARNGMDVEHVYVESAVTTNSHVELRKSLLSVLNSGDNLFGTPAFYLRVIQRDTTHSAQRMYIAGEAAPDGGLSANFSRRVGELWERPTADAFLERFFRSARGAPLVAANWKGALVEVLPATLRRFSETVLQRKKERGTSPRAGFALADNTGNLVPAYTRATSRVFVAFDERTREPYMSVVTKALPIEPGVRRLVNLPTANFEPIPAIQEPAFIPREAPAEAEHRPGDALLL